jgi:hypothetical protein
MFDHPMDMVGVFVEGLRRIPVLRVVLMVLSLIFLAFSLASLLVLKVHIPDFLAPDTVEEANNVIIGVLVASIIVLVICVISYTPARFKSGGIFGLELELLHSERDQIQKRIAQKPEPDVLDTIQLSLNQLSEYYTINKSQARNSFRFSVFAVVVGLITLISGIWYFYLGDQQNIQMTVISGISCVLIEFIGGAYFYLYRKSLEQLNFFFGQLIRMQDTMLSVRLCDQVVPDELKNSLKEKVILTLLERSSKLSTAQITAST